MQRRIENAPPKKIGILDTVFRENIYVKIEYEELKILFDSLETICVVGGKRIPMIRGIGSGALVQIKEMATYDV